MTWRRTLTAGAVALVIAAVTLGSLLFAIDRGWQRSRIVGYATRLLENELGVEIAIENARGWLSRGLTLERIIVGPPDAPLARIDFLDVRWRPLSLLRGDRWVVDRIRIRGWSSRLERAASGEWAPLEELIGRWNPEEGASTAKISPVDGSSKSNPQRFFVRRIEIIESELGLVLERPPGTSLSAPVRARLMANAEVGDLLVVTNDPSLDAPIQLGRGTLTARLLELDSGLTDLDAAARATLDLRTAGLELESARLDVDVLGVRGKGEATGRFELLETLTLHLESDDLSTLNVLALTPEPLRGQIEASATLSGPIQALEGSVAIEARNLEFLEMRARDLTLALDLRDPLTPEAIDLASLNAGLRMRARQLDLGKHAREWIPAGSADIDIDAELRSGRVDLRRGEFRHPDLSLDASGKGSRDEIEALELRFSARDVTPWLELWRPDLPLHGAIEGNAAIRGRLEYPTGRVDLRSQSIEFSGEKMGALNLEIERSSNRPARVHLVLGSETAEALRLDGTIDAGGERFDFEGAANAASWSSFVGRSASGKTRIEAKIEAAGYVARTAAGPRFEIALQSEGTAFETVDVGRVELSVARTNASRIDVANLSIAGPNGGLELEEPIQVLMSPNQTWSLENARLRLALLGEADVLGSARLSATGKSVEVATLDAQLDAVPMALANRFLSNQPPLSGRLSGQARWQKKHLAEWTTGSLEWREPTIGQVRLDLIEAHWTGGPSAIDFELETRLAQASPIALRGRIGLPDPGKKSVPSAFFERLSLDANLADWDLSALESMTPEWMRKLSGSISGSVRIEQTPQGLQLSGQTRVDNGGFVVPILRQRFAPINGTLHLDGRTLSVDSLQIGADDASAQLVGKVEFPENSAPQIDGRIRFDDFPLARSSAAHLDVLGGIDLAGTWEQPTIRGKLSIANGRIGIPASDDPVMKEIRITTRGQGGMLFEAEEAEADPLGKAEIELEIAIPESTRVRDQGANFFVEGTARVVKKTDSSPRVLGEARVVNGNYVFQGRSFEVRRGRLSFTGDEHIDPLIDVEARLRVSDIVAIVELSGRLSSPILRLTSEPPRSDQDVLSYILFGREANQVAEAESSGFSAASARLVAGVAEKEVRDILGDAMPIDSIEIGADAEGNTSELGFGKYLSPKLFFRYVHVLGDEPADRVGVEYRINDTFSVGSSVSTTGDAGLDLILRHDF